MAISLILVEDKKWKSVKQHIELVNSNHANLYWKYIDLVFNVA